MINVRISTLFLAIPFLMGMSLEERRLENDRIQVLMRNTQEVNRRPSPDGSPRANRIARNSYRNCCTEPRLPRTIWREPIRPPFPTGHKRFYGGIPR